MACAPVCPHCPQDWRPLCRLAGLSVSQPLTPRTRPQPGKPRPAQNISALYQPRPLSHPHPCSALFIPPGPHEASPDLTACRSGGPIARPPSQASSPLTAEEAKATPASLTSGSLGPCLEFSGTCPVGQTGWTPDPSLGLKMPGQAPASSTAFSKAGLLEALVGQPGPAPWAPPVL